MKKRERRERERERERERKLEKNHPAALNSPMALQKAIPFLLLSARSFQHPLKHACICFPPHAHTRARKHSHHIYFGICTFGNIQSRTCSRQTHTHTHTRARARARAPRTRWNASRLTAFLLFFLRLLSDKLLKRCVTA